MFPQRFESLLNSYKFPIGFVLGIYNSKSRGVWKLAQKGNLSQLNISTLIPSLEIFGTLKVPFS
jgi:hypothetical protein